jgi:hypothetical protein
MESQEIFSYKLIKCDINICITTNGETMKDTKDNEIRIRLTSEDKELIENNSKKFGFVSISEYLRYIGKNTKEINIRGN